MKTGMQNFQADQKIELTVPKIQTIKPDHHETKHS
ncbi:Uncharacterised protein [Chryseobacterium carnipullorum]|uniref:Uncharacterized protein n=1 Tax=Chryseobacterium carnipullorum TaxID=1124835 RepID=A0A376DRG0_CHRCU|nr:Uncharacterised protein [Chryseobacterium carnipullorum]